jgi:hypothetical protein
MTKKGNISTRGKETQDWTWTDFKHTIRNYMLYGIPATDKKGHSETIHYRVMPFGLDIFAEICSLIPDGWLRDPKTGKRQNNSILHRIIFTVGCSVLLQILKEDKEINGSLSQLESKLQMLNEIRKKQRLSELQLDAENLQEEIIRSNLKDKTEVVQKIESISNEIFSILNNPGL